MRSHVLRGLAFAVVLASMAQPSTAGETSAPLDAYLQAAAHAIPASARSALSRIEDTPRQLLALRSYARMGERLHERWSWSQARVDSFVGSEQHRELLAAVEQVRMRFEQQNPGYTLYANTQTRSLDDQLHKWNRNPRVARVAASLQRDAVEELRKGGYDAAPQPAHVNRFIEFLRDWRPPTPAPLAAPGLSLHGQARAIDFQIMKDGEIVAGADMASVRTEWEGRGWSRKLQQAVEGAAFVGPLKAPNEPWHYEYIGGDERTASTREAH